MTIDAPRRPQHFYITTPLPCPYMPGRLERKVITELRGPNVDRLHDVLSRAGFRRSHSIAYVPGCPSCSACVPVRVAARDFLMRASLKRILKRNRDLTATPCPARATEEQYRLFTLYQDARHDDGDMARMDFRDYGAMVEDTCVTSQMIEFRDPGHELIACCLTDRLGDGLSAVYSFFDPARARRSLGTLMVLHLIRMARENDLPFVYLGYWIRHCRKMSYKTRFQPLEALTPAGWRTLDPERDGHAPDCRNPG